MLPYDPNNVFAKIIRGELPSRTVYEDHLVKCFHTIDAKSKVHLLAIPKGNYIGYQDFIRSASDAEILHFFKTIDKIAIQYGISENYKLVTNHGAKMGQEVFHFHVHLMSNDK